MEHLARTRLSRLGLDRPLNSAEAAVAHLTAVQAQVWSAAQLTVRARAPQSTAREIDDLVESGRLVWAWLNRETLHLVRREDFWDLQRATSAARLTILRSRFRSDGIDDVEAHRIADRLAPALGAEPLSKSELLPLVELERYDVAPARRSIFVANVVELLGARGELVRAPKAGNEPKYLSATAALGPEPSTSSVEETWATLARRYATAHWPARPDDFAAWLGIGKTTARSAWRDADLHTDPSPARVSDARWTGLLGPFDAALHGWPDRRWLLGDYVGRILTTNGVFRASIIVEDRCVGTWSTKSGAVELDVFEAVSSANLTTIAEQVGQIETFMESATRA
ncbi:MAG TPA: crosslink repair DNA glycosylase YcaQ family protein [Microbacteriaceae bacterium]|nr:crosslink repair DNA glycosylase YcaQ family protein [Microbacteriaceae bacterium]